MQDYETVRKLGQGAMGSVALVRRRSDRRLLALKSVAIFSSHDRQVAANEVKILGSLSHPHVVRFEGSFVHETDLCIVMQHCPGGDLAELRTKRRRMGKRLPDSAVRCVLSQLASALAHVHSKRIVHRDIKAPAAARACQRGARV